MISVAFRHEPLPKKGFRVPKTYIGNAAGKALYGFRNSCLLNDLPGDLRAGTSAPDLRLSRSPRDNAEEAKKWSLLGDKQIQYS